MNTPVSPERAEQVRKLFDVVADLAPEERGPRLLQEEDPTLRGQVESLLAAYDCADDVLRALEQPAPAVSDPLIARKVSHFQIIEKLGGGGMGVVYRARDLKLDRTVALKFLPPHLSADAEAKRRFITEAKAASALDHPHIGVVHEIGETADGRLFIAMAFYAGETLKKKIARGPLPVEEAVAYAAQMAEGLAVAHEANIVHRDVKPANVMVTERGRVKLVDFGLAKRDDVSLTQTGTTLGTISYMSPEQAQGKPVDHRTDLWSLGVVVYEMLTGAQPFSGDYAQAIIHAILKEEPAPVRTLRPEVPVAVAGVVAKLLEKDPAARYENARDVLADLDGPRRVKDTAQPTGRAALTLSFRRPRVLAYGATVLVLLLALIAYFSLTGPPTPLDSIAVLPLENLTGSPEQAYFVDGMTEALIGNLGRIKGLRRVISRTSVMRFKGTDRSLPEIGRALDVAVVVEGSVRAHGDQVQIDVRLIDAGTEERLWEQSFVRAMGDVLALQNEVARAIAQAVAVQLTPMEEAHLAEAPAVNPEVYDLYLKGLQARVEDMLNRQLTIEYFEQAVALDSSFAPAYAALAIEYALLGGFDLLHGGEVKATQFAERALSLDPSLSEPYVALGLVRELVDWDWAGAEAAFLQAIERSPGDAFAHHELAELLMRLGRFEEALTWEKQALYLDPLSARYQSGVGEVYLYSRRYDAAIAELEKAMALNPNVGPYYLGHAYWHKGQYEEALRWWEGPGIMDIVLETGRIRYAAVQGQQEKARGALREMEAAWAQGEGGLFILWSIALIYTDLGDTDQALKWLERAFDEHLGFLVYLKVEPGFIPLHDEPRFQALLAKMGLGP